MDAWALIPLAAIIMWGAQGIARAVFGRPSSRELRETRDRGGDGTRVELEDLRRRVTELEERQDFTERMLTRGRGGGAGGTV